MANSILQYRCLIISPGDVAEHRGAVESALHDWNAHQGRQDGVRIEPVRWERGTAPELGDRAQAIVNKQIVEDCDVGVAIFSARVGTETGGFPSGSFEEIHELQSRGRRVFVYFETGPVDVSSIDPDQLKRLKVEKERLRKEGLLGDFNGVDSLVRQVITHVPPHVLRLQKARSAEVATDTAPLPDVRVRLMSALVGYDAKPHAMIKVENHSSRPFHLANVAFELDTANLLVFPKDSLGRQMMSITIDAEHSWEAALSPEIFKNPKVRGHVVACIVKDTINREYRADPDEVRKIVELMARQE